MTITILWPSSLPSLPLHYNHHPHCYHYHNHLHRCNYHPTNIITINTPIIPINLMMAPWLLPSSLPLHRYSGIMVLIIITTLLSPSLNHWPTYHLTLSITIFIAVQSQSQHHHTQHLNRRKRDNCVSGSKFFSKYKKYNRLNPLLTFQTSTNIWRDTTKVGFLIFLFYLFIF